MKSDQAPNPFWEEKENLVFENALQPLSPAPSGRAPPTPFTGQLLLPFPPRHPGQVDTLSAFRGLDPSPTVFPPQGESLQHAGSRLDL